MKSKFSSAFVTVATLLVVPACQTPPPAAPAVTTISCQIPTVTALPETKESQEKGGLEIGIVPAVYTAEKVEEVVLEQAQPGFGGMIAVSLATGGNSGSQVYVRETTTPALRPTPARLAFTVRVNNKLSRVFRGQGSVVQFNVAGKLMDFGKTDYAAFINGIVPPRNQAEFVIYGPALDALPEKGTIGIFLYDVVTATDVAGSTTEKQNYEWYYNFEKRTVTQEAAVKVAEGFMDARTYQQRMMAEQQKKMMEVMRTQAVAR